MTNATAFVLGVSCGEPGKVTNATASVLGVSCGEPVKVTNATASVLGVSCGEPGKVTNATASVLGVSCGEPDSVANASVSASGSGSYEDVRTYTCDSGYQLDSGDLTRTCMSSGVWSGKPPSCKGNIFLYCCV